MAQQTMDPEARQAIIDEFRAPWVEEYTDKRPKSKQLFEDPRTRFSARTYRDFARGAPYPYYIEAAQGFTLRDVDGNELIDFGNNATALVHGHAHPYIEQAIIGALRTGTSYSGSHIYRDRLAEMIAERMPGVEKVTFAMSGTEADMYAVRIARAYSGKDKVLWFGGGYHGTYDPVHAGPTFRGYPESVEQDYLMADFNDKEGTERLIAEHKDELAAVLIEPVQGTAGYIAPREDFLQFLRDVTTKYGVLLIFDEVITGFRWARGGAQEYYHVRPAADIVAMGKVMGGGLPNAAVGASDHIMEVIRSLPVENQAQPDRRPTVPMGGTYSGYKLGCAAGIAALELLTHEAYERLNGLGARLIGGLKSVCSELGVKAQVTGDASIAGIHMTDKDVWNGEIARNVDAQLNGLVRFGLLRHGVIWGTGGLSLNTVMTEREVDKAVEALRETLLEMRPLLERVAPEMVG